MTHNLSRLASAGYLPGPRGTIMMPDGDPVPAHLLPRLAQVAGRLSNLAYMANAIDIYLVLPEPAAPVPGGDDQFYHLLEHESDQSGDMNRIAQIYVSLRRLQVARDLPGLRAGLALLIAADLREIAYADALRMVEATAQSVDLPSFPEDTAPARRLSPETLGRVARGIDKFILPGAGSPFLSKDTPDDDR